MSKADTYDPLHQEDELLDCRYEVFKGVWEEASDLGTVESCSGLEKK